MKGLLIAAAAGEALTGLALLAAPGLVARLLFGAELDGAGAVMGRIAGVALLALGVGCWPDAAGRGAVRGLLTYGVLVTPYLAWLGLGGQWTGKLLWPAVGLHGVLTLLLAGLGLKNPPGDRRAGRGAGDSPAT